jgi:predicted SPOUT superfamily RNA methylase MTH1
MGVKMDSMKRSTSLQVVIPSSITMDTPHLREKTYKIGLIGRACAIFRVDEVIIYRDCEGKKCKRQIELISSILSYIETPQYLRRRLFPISKFLKYVGILPPLRTPHHPTSKRVGEMSVNEYREGVVTKTDGKNSFIDIGIDKTVFLSGKKLPVNSRVTVKIIDVKKRNIDVQLVKSDEIKQYWGYRVSDSSLSLGKTVQKIRPALAIATSRKGEKIDNVYKQLQEEMGKSNRLIIAFGSPREGLNEILRRENLKLKNVFDFTINTIPFQGTKTVRTEEAIFASLALLNSISQKGIV